MATIQQILTGQECQEHVGRRHSSFSKPVLITMGAAREPDQADFDLERFVDMFDEALTSKDPRVMETLRSLMMIVTLTRPEARDPMSDRNAGPLRRLFDDMHQLHRRVSRMEEEQRDMQNRLTRDQFDKNRVYSWDNQDKYTMAGAGKMAQQIDQDVLDQMRRQQHQAAMQIVGKVTLGPENKAKGLK